jgi:hypothetical protein
MNPVRPILSLYVRFNTEKAGMFYAGFHQMKGGLTG